MNVLADQVDPNPVPVPALQPAMGPYRKRPTAATRQIPGFWAFSFMGSGIVANLTQGSVRFIALGLACASLAGFAFLAHLSTSNSRARTTKGQPLAWLILAYISIVLQEFGRSDFDSSAVISSIPAIASIGSAGVIWLYGYSFSTKHLRYAIYAFFVGGVLVGLAVGRNVQPCRFGKCSPFGVLYTGGFSHENTMGYAAILAFTLIAFGTPHSRFPNVAFKAASFVPLLAAIASGARSTLYTAAITCLFLWSRRLWGAWEHLVYRTVPFVVSAMSLYLIYTVEQSDFSFRGRRWIAIRESLSPVPILGNGVGGWTDLTEGWIVTTTTSHSVYGSYLVQGGLVALFFYLCFLSLLLMNTRKRGAGELSALSIFFMVLSIFYSLWEPMSLASRGWVLLALVLSIPHASVDSVRLVKTGVVRAKAGAGTHGQP